MMRVGVTEVKSFNQKNLKAILCPKSAPCQEYYSASHEASLPWSPPDRYYK